VRCRCQTEILFQVGMPLVDANHSAENAGNVVEKLFNHFDSHIQSSEAGGEGSSQIVQGPMFEVVPFAAYGTRFHI
jgi:hypothetical protein